MNVVHPLIIGTAPVVRDKADFTALHRLDRLFSQRGYFYVPLVGQVGLNDRSGTIAPGHHQPVVISLLDQAKRGEVGDDLLPGIVAIHSVIGRIRQSDCRINGHHIDQIKLVSLTHLIIIEIMGRCDFHATRSELRVDIIISNDRDLPGGQRQLHTLADQVQVALIKGMYGNGSIPKHGLRAGSRNNNMTFAIGPWITEVPEMPRLLFRDHLKVRNSGVENRVPVDQPLSSIDQPLPIEPDKDLSHSVRESFVHGESLPRPVE